MPIIAVAMVALGIVTLVYWRKRKFRGHNERTVEYINPGYDLDEMVGGEELSIVREGVHMPTTYRSNIYSVPA